MNRDDLYPSGFRNAQSFPFGQTGGQKLNIYPEKKKDVKKSDDLAGVEWPFFFF